MVVAGLPSARRRVPQRSQTPPPAVWGAYLRYTQRQVRRIVAILLAHVFSFLLMLPFFASNSEIAVPACCRRAGKHHCMSHVQSSPGTGPAVASITAKCSSFPRAAVTKHVQEFSPFASSSIYAGLVSHPSVIAQTEAGYRTAFDTSRQKRGPPHSHRSSLSV